MQEKRKSNKVNNKGEMGVKENINKPMEQDKKRMLKEGSSTCTKERNNKRCK